MDERDLPPPERALYLKSKHAYESGNYAYVIQLCQVVLREVPGFLEARKLLRSAALLYNKGIKTGGSSVISLHIKGMTAAEALKKDPRAAMELAEQALATDPNGFPGNQLLYAAAKNAGFPAVAAYALETLIAANPRDTKLMQQLAEHYRANGEEKNAEAVQNKITKLNTPQPPKGM